MRALSLFVVLLSVGCGKAPVETPTMKARTRLFETPTDVSTSTSFRIPALAPKGEADPVLFAREVLGIRSTATTPEVIDSLYAWPSVVHVTRAGLGSVEVGVA